MIENLTNSLEQALESTKEQMNEWSETIEQLVDSADENFQKWDDSIESYDVHEIVKETGKGAIIGGGIGCIVPGFGTVAGTGVGALSGGFGNIVEQTTENFGTSETTAEITGVVASSVGGVMLIPKTGLVQFAKHSDELLEAIKSIGKQEITQLPTLNSKLDGITHEITDVPFEKRIVDTPRGKVEGVWAKFDSVYDYSVPKESFDSDGVLRWSDAKQFKNAVENLSVSIEKNPKLAEKFTSEQRELIKLGITPKEFTWHHKEDKGILQLVDSSIHDKTAHTGGAKLWTARHENT